MPTKRFQSKSLQHVYEKVVATDLKKQAAFEREHDDILVQIAASQLLHEMRTQAGLSQRELAKRRAFTR